MHDGFDHDAVFSSGNGAPGFGTTRRRRRAGIKVGASTQFGGTGWDSIARIGQVTDNDVMVWSDRGPGRPGRPARRRRRRRVLVRATETPQHGLDDGRVAWETWGGTSRSTPVAGRRDRSRLPGLPQGASAARVAGGFFPKPKGS